LELSIPTNWYVTVPVYVIVVVVVALALALALVVVKTRVVRSGREPAVEVRSGQIMEHSKLALFGKTRYCC
jgi:hypothetical protein